MSGKRSFFKKFFSILREKSGIAMLFSIISITLVAAYVTEFAYNMRIYIKMSKNIKGELQAYYNARSAVNIAKLVVDSGDITQALTSLIPGAKKLGGSLELWRFACKFTEIFSTGKLELFGVNVLDLKGVDGVGVENGTFGCEIETEDGKINLNRVGSLKEKQTLFKEIFALFKNYFRTKLEEESDDELFETIARIIDWADSDKVKTTFDPSTGLVSEGGAETDDYSEYGYKIKNAKFDSTEEVKLVKGVDEELFCKFLDKFTVYDTYKLNINTANIEVLKALICEFLRSPNKDYICGIGSINMISPIDIVGEFIDTCRKVKLSLFLLPFPRKSSFTNLLRNLPEPLNKDFIVDTAGLSRVISTTSKVIRIKAFGKTKKSEKKIQAIIDTSRHNFVYFREY